MSETKLTVWRKRIVMWTGVVALVEPNIIEYVSPIALTFWMALFAIDVLFNTELTFYSEDNSEECRKVEKVE